MDFKRIDLLAQQAVKPLEDEWLESLNVNDEPYWRFLHLVAKELKAERALVIGTWMGEDVAHIARAGADCVGVDINYNQDWIKIQDNEPRAWFVVGDSRSAPVGFDEFDLIFQDSSHHYLESIEEWDRFWPMLRPGGVWVCDDITPSFWNKETDPPGLGMVQYFESRPGKKKLYPNLHKGSVIGVIIK